MKTKEIQIRGNCQCCGREQAVIGGLMSKHGYTVEHGWFNGVCSGNRYSSMQTSRKETDTIVFDIRAEIPKLLANADQYEAGTLLPKVIIRQKLDANLKKRINVEVAYADATDYEQESARKQAAWNLRSRARSGEQFANQLEDIANKVHGQPLNEVVKKEVVYVQPGEKKVNKDTGLIYTCVKVEGARVWWTAVRSSDGKIMKSWTGSAAWKRMETV